MVIEVESLYSTAFPLMMKSWHFPFCGIQCESGAACQLGNKLCQEGLDCVKKGLFARTGKHFFLQNGNIRVSEYGLRSV